MDMKQPQLFSFIKWRPADLPLYADGRATLRAASFGVKGPCDHPSPAAGYPMCDVESSIEERYVFNTVRCIVCASVFIL